ncbi:hypothetical protein ACNF42_01470 [Cuniculiplasma sp. SKW3]|uniref:hypothetical protein n=1 Tax=Cuniculiplasma sp. SKW3 TaxID=3400170 RepID=UPI003FD1C27A
MRYKRESKEKNSSRIMEIEKSLENPISLVPECIDGGMFCPLGSYAKKLGNVHGIEELEKLGKSKDEFLRGIGETARAIRDKDVSFSGLLKTPHGSATFYKKGDTDQYVLAGIQNSKNDIFRMLAFSRDVINGKLTIYSAGDYFKGSCKRSPPEDEFIVKVLDEEMIEHKEDNDGLQSIGQGDESFTISIYNHPVVRVYSSSKVKTLWKLMKHILCQDPMKTYSYLFQNLNEFSSKSEYVLFQKYVNGEMNDSEFINEIMNERINRARDSGKFIIGKSIFPNFEDFLTAIPLEKVERDAIKTLWSTKNGIYIETSTRRKFLEAVWDKIGTDLLKMLSPSLTDEQISSLKGNPTEMIEKARKIQEISKVSKEIDLKPWSPASQYLASLVIAGRHGGKDEILEVMGSKKISDPDAMAVDHAFVIVTETGKSESWKASDNAKLKGEMLIPYVRRMLNGTPEDARSAFLETEKFLR